MERLKNVEGEFKALDCLHAVIDTFLDSSTSIQIYESQMQLSQYLSYKPVLLEINYLSFHKQCSSENKLPFCLDNSSAVSALISEKVKEIV